MEVHHDEMLVKLKKGKKKFFMWNLQIICPSSSYLITLYLKFEVFMEWNSGQVFQVGYL